MRLCETPQLGALRDSRAHGGWKSAELMRTCVHKSSRMAVSAVMICNLLQRYHLDVFRCPHWWDPLLMTNISWLLALGWGTKFCYLERLLLIMLRNNRKEQKEHWAAVSPHLKFLCLCQVRAFQFPWGQLHTILSGKRDTLKSTWQCKILPMLGLSPTCQFATWLKW